MPFESPPLKVSRPIAACQRCRQAKTRCDGKLPACTACERAGKADECSSINDQFAKGKERSYVATLENRIDKLRRKVADAQERKRKGSVVSMMTPIDTPTIPRGTNDPRNARQQRRKEAGDIDSLVSNFGVLTVNAAARDFHGFTETMSYSRIVISAATKEPLPENCARGLPPREEAIRIAQHYLSNLYLFLPAFEEISFYSSLERIYNKRSATAQPLDFWIVFCVLAISCVSQSTQRHDASYTEGVGYIASALKNKEEVLRPGRVDGMQAMLLLIQYARFDPCHFDSWTLVGAVSRAMVDLGLHQDPSRESSMSKARLQTRRRVFHCVYALDRSTSIVLNRAFSFSDDAANVAFPSLPGRSSAPTHANGHPAKPPPINTTNNHSYNADSQQLWHKSNDESFGLHKLRRIQSQWFQEVFLNGLDDDPWVDGEHYLWGKWHEMQEWYIGMAPTLSPRARVLAEIEVLVSHIFLLAPSPKIPHVPDLSQNLMFEHAVAFAPKILHALDEPSTRPWVTALDALRTHRVGAYFCALLRNHWDHILSGAMPRAPSISAGAPTPPPYPYAIRLDNPMRAYKCLEELGDALAKFALRFGMHEKHNEFTIESSPILAQLQFRISGSLAMASSAEASMPMPGMM